VDALEVNIQEEQREKFQKGEKKLGKGEG